MRPAIPASRQIRAKWKSSPARSISEGFEWTCRSIAPKTSTGPVFTTPHFLSPLPPSLPPPPAGERGGPAPRAWGGGGVRRGDGHHRARSGRKSDQEEATP